MVCRESGALAAGLQAWLMRSPKACGARGLRTALGLSGRSSVLLINTEGDTVPELYREILRGGGPCVMRELTRAHEVFACGPAGIRPAMRMLSIFGGADKCAERLWPV